MSKKSNKKSGLFFWFIIIIIIVAIAGVILGVSQYRKSHEIQLSNANNTLSNTFKHQDFQKVKNDFFLKKTS